MNFATCLALGALGRGDLVHELTANGHGSMRWHARPKRAPLVRKRLIESCHSRHTLSALLSGSRRRSKAYSLLVSCGCSSSAKDCELKPVPRPC